MVGWFGHFINKAYGVALYTIDAEEGTDFTEYIRN